ncbi:GPI transamidase component PIG-T [Plasmodiophora brassicae]
MPLSGCRAAAALALAVVVVAGVAARPDDDGEEFHERLTVRPLPAGHVLLHFDFNMTTERPLDPNDEHYRLFPKSIGQIITKYQVAEFDIRLTQGRWRYSTWGTPILDAPSGAQLLAWIEANSSVVADHRWAGVQQTLSGVLCASLQQIGTDIHTSHPPSTVFPPLSDDIGSARLHYGVLPREVVCTENTTPWAKLLPCRTRAGLGSLISPLDLHDSSYHSMGITVFSERAGTGRRRWVARFTLSAVLDPVYRSNTKQWTLKSLISHVPSVASCSPVSSSCTLIADSSLVGPYGGTLTPRPDAVPSSSIGGVATYSLQGSQVDLAFSSPNRVPAAPAPPVLVQRHVTGRGLQSGGICVTVVNTRPAAQTVAVYDTLPWYFRVYYHTLALTINGSSLALPGTTRFRPARHSGTPNTIEMQFDLPAHSTALITFQFEKVFLPIKDFPPDVSRGFDLGPAVVRCLPNGPRLYTESLVVLFPGPDMSMPFNVIAFTSTFLAFFFGTMFNTLYRHPTELANRVRGGIVIKLIRRVSARLSAGVRRVLGRSAPTGTGEKDKDA